MLEAYHNLEEKYPTFRLNPDFKALLHNMITSSKTTYELSDICNTFRYLPYFKFEDEKSNIEKILFEKITKIENSISYLEIREFLYLMIGKGNGKYINVPKNV